MGTNSKTNKGNFLDISKVRQVLSHKYPMLLIDKILEYEPGVNAKAVKLFSYNEDYFRGHYPGVPIVPGTLLLEGMSQTAAFTILAKMGGLEENVLFTGVNRLRFLQVVTPGDKVMYNAEVVKNIHGLWVVDGKGYMGNKTCITAEMTFVKMR